MSGVTKTTTDHEEIRRWAEEREGRPVGGLGTGAGADPGVLRISFPGAADESLEEIGWEEWFAKFDENRLAFIYQERKASGERSTFFKLVRRNRE